MGYSSQAFSPYPAMHPNYIKTSFAALPIGAEFLWGGYYIDRCNWGRKRSSCTADWRPLICGELSSFESWGYWKQSEACYVLREVQP
jgi:hypothetical protein